MVIDVGVNRVGMTKEGKAILCGDVDFEAVKEKAGADHPGSRRSRPHDHYHADDEHGESGQSAAGCERVM